MPSYILRGSTQRGRKVASVTVENGRALVLNGAPVPLSDEEYEALQHSYVLEGVEVPEPQPDANSTDEAEAESTEHDNKHTEKGGVK